ncbi:hypothetical protein M0Q97_06935, partial [Candidatus Dojkabacteria bacterium]|nr:hypothetical protein [Candidatus Dojkabacteria bacterium]
KEKNDKTLNFEDFIKENVDEIDELSSDDELQNGIEPILDDDDDDDDDDDVNIENDDDNDNDINIENDDDDDDIKRIKNFDDFDFEDRIDDIEDRLDNIEDKIEIQDDEIQDDEIQDDEEDEEIQDEEIQDDEEDEEIQDEEFEGIKSFESFNLREVSPKNKKKEQPKYTMLGEEQEPKTDSNFGIGAIKDQEIKKIAWFNNYVIDPQTPKERPILNAGQFIDNDTVKGYVNRIEGKNVYVESLDEPMTIKKFNIKDIVKIKK